MTEAELKLERIRRSLRKIYRCKYDLKLRGKVLELLNREFPKK